MIVLSSQSHLTGIMDKDRENILKIVNWKRQKGREGSLNKISSSWVRLSLTQHDHATVFS